MATFNIQLEESHIISKVVVSCEFDFEQNLFKQLEEDMPSYMYLKILPMFLTILDFDTSMNLRLGSCDQFPL